MNLANDVVAGHIAFEPRHLKLFNQVLYNPLHVLHHLLSRHSTASQNYNLRPRKHDKELPKKTTHLTDSNFINTLVFSGLY